MQIQGHVSTTFKHVAMGRKWEQGEKNLKGPLYRPLIMTVCHKMRGMINSTFCSLKYKKQKQKNIRTQRVFLCIYTCAHMRALMYEISSGNMYNNLNYGYLQREGWGFTRRGSLFYTFCMVYIFALCVDDVYLNNNSQ